MIPLIKNFGGMDEKGLVPLNKVRIFIENKGYGVITIH
jgi:hypothetical protein